MKAETLVDMLGPNPEFDFEEARKAHEEGRVYDVPMNVEIPKGEEIDDPKAYLLVRLGCAQPADEECKTVANVDLSDAAIKARLKRYIKTTKGMATGIKKYDATPKTETKKKAKT